MRANRARDYNLAFIDFLLGLVAVLVILIIVFMASINPVTEKAEKAGIDSDAQVLATIEWDPKIDCDVDFYARDSNGEIVYFRQKDSGIMSIERDDRGIVHDTVIASDGKEVSSPLNKEYWTLRGKLPGSYILNAHLFNCVSAIAPAVRVDDAYSNIGVKTSEPVHIKAQLIQVNPSYRVVAMTEHTFYNIWEERTLFSFDLDENGQIKNVDTVSQEDLVTSETRSN